MDRQATGSQPANVFRPGFALVSGEFFMAVEYNQKRNVYETRFLTEAPCNGKRDQPRDEHLYSFTLAGLKAVLKDLTDNDLRWMLEEDGARFESNMGIRENFEARVRDAGSDDAQMRVVQKLDMLCNLLAQCKATDHSLSDRFHHSDTCPCQQKYRF
jgi:hypothetical protein